MMFSQIEIEILKWVIWTCLSVLLIIGASALIGAIIGIWVNIRDS